MITMSEQPTELSATSAINSNPSNIPSFTSKSLVKNAAKKAMVYFRELGYDKKECALMAGYSLDTLKDWAHDDPEFSLALAQGWMKYQGTLIQKVKDKDPKYLLQNDFPKRFKKDKEIEKPDQTINFIGYDQLAARLAGLIRGSERGSTSSNPAQEA